MLFINRHPIAVLLIDINPLEIDVNVHPTKDIIRIKDEEKFYNEVFNGLKRNLLEKNLVPEVGIKETARETKIYSFDSSVQANLVSKEEVKQKPKVEPYGIGEYRILGR